MVKVHGERGYFIEPLRIWWFSALPLPFPLEKTI